MNKVSIEIKDGTTAADLVNPFYEKHGSKGRARPHDTFFMAMQEGQLIGCVRFCVEENTPLLRTMMVHEEYRRKGIGRLLLEEFRRFLDSKGIKNVYCIPYTHLEKFYGTIGFKKIKSIASPSFLNERAQMYDPSGGRYIIMKRI